jgi:hypothetical protein
MRTMREITRAEVENVKKHWDWELATDTLLNLCKHHPKHERLDEIIAKVLLIGRSNAAAIERRRDIRVRGDFYLERVGPIIEKANIDSWLAELDANSLPGCPLSIIIHRKLEKLFFKIAKLSKRSLASKYLHFHFPEVFFIFDSRASRAIKLVTPRLKEIQDDYEKPYDRTYKDFVRRCVWLRDDIHAKYNTWLSPRQIDRLLLAIDGSRRTKDSREKS